MINLNGTITLKHCQREHMLPLDTDGDGETDKINTYPDGFIGHGLRPKDCWYRDSL